jgi:hypothetical protein
VLGVWDEGVHFSEEEGVEISNDAVMGGVKSADSVHDHRLTVSGIRMGLAEHDERAAGCRALRASRRLEE